MDGPDNGKYWIRPVTEPMLSVGVQVEGDRPIEAPVITGGRDDIFLVTKTQDGKYTLMAGSRNDWNIQTTGARPDIFVVGSTYPPPSTWVISGPPGGPYTILEEADLVGVSKSWALGGPGPDQRVVIMPFPIVPGVELPKWNFVRWPGSE